MAAERRARWATPPCAARAIGYVGAGTVEFIGRAGRHVLLHGDEHAAAGRASGHRDDHGLDLVEWQLRVASASRCPARRTSSRSSGHAIEARLYAEDPDRGFLPSIGTLSHWRCRTAGTVARRHRLSAPATT
jgi:3-methylcrotonyl-CoA carboxylase alpha subunit